MLAALRLWLYIQVDRKYAPRSTSWFRDNASNYSRSQKVLHAECQVAKNGVQAFRRQICAQLRFVEETGDVGEIVC